MNKAVNKRKVYTHIWAEAKQLFDPSIWWKHVDADTSRNRRKRGEIELENLLITALRAPPRIGPDNNS